MFKLNAIYTMMCDCVTLNNDEKYCVLSVQPDGIKLEFNVICYEHIKFDVFVDKLNVSNTENTIRELLDEVCAMKKTINSLSHDVNILDTKINKTEKEYDNKHLMIKCDKFKHQKLSFTDIDFENPKSAAQGIANGKYQYGSKIMKLVIKTDPIQFTQEYQDEDIIKYNKHYYINIPINTEQQSCVDLGNMMKTIDTHMLKNQNKYLGDLAEYYEYTSIIKKPLYYYPYCEIMINVNSESDNEIETKVFDNSEQTCEPTLIKHIKNINDLSKCVEYNNEYTLILILDKLWADKTADKGKKRKFGVTFKLLQIGINTMPLDFTEDLFLTQALTTKCYDSDEDEDCCDSDDEESEEEEEEEEYYDDYEQIAIKCNELRQQKISFMCIDYKNLEIKNQGAANGKYQYDSKTNAKLIVKTDPIQLTQNSENHITSHNTHDYIKIPIDPEQQSCVDLGNMMKTIDAHMMINHNKYLNDLGKYSKYVPIIKEPYHHYPYCEIMINVDPKSNDEIKTKVFDNHEQTRKLALVKNTNDLLKCIEHNNECVFVLMLDKLWIDKVVKRGAKFKFGVTFKLLQIEINTVQSDFTKNLFLA
jgi:hypothetical protein